MRSLYFSFLKPLVVVQALNIMAPQFMFLIGKHPLIIIIVPFLCILSSVISLVSLPILWLKGFLLNPRGFEERIRCLLPRVCYTAEVYAKLTDCAICLMEYEGGDVLRVLPHCGHGFHADCVERWLKCHSSCPSCRTEVMQSNEAQILGDADTPPFSDTVCDTSNPYRLTFWHP